MKYTYKSSFKRSAIYSMISLFKVSASAIKIIILLLFNVCSTVSLKIHVVLYISLINIYFFFEKLRSFSYEIYSIFNRGVDRFVFNKGISLSIPVITASTNLSKVHLVLLCLDVMTWISAARWVNLILKHKKRYWVFKISKRKFLQTKENKD